jgi:hypothetical protein
MNPQSRISRRRLLSAVGTAALAIGGLLRVQSGLGRHSLRALWLSVVPARSSRAVGRAYLASSRAAPDVPTLLRQILPHAELAVALEDDVDGLRQHLRGRIEEDFDSGRTVQLHGWVLAETEARMCALVALL